jgi:hypothetical protein
MMDRLDIKKGAVAPAPFAPLITSGSQAIYPLPTEYRKPIRFRVGDRIIKLTGGRALVLDRLMAAGPSGIDRAATLQWVANLADTIAALRVVGIAIETRKRQPCNYALQCHVERIGGAA